MTSTARTAPDADPDQADTGTVMERGQPRWTRWATRLRPYRIDLTVCLLFLLLAAWVTHGMWPDPGARVLALNPEDQALYEWFLAADARVLRGDFGLLSDRLNAPDGVNLMANTTVIALGVLFAPVTLVAGAPTTFALLAAGNLAGTAIAWYLLYTRTMRAGRLAAALGAGLCGFAPGMVSQTNSHLHMTAQWLVPVLVWQVVRLVRASDPANHPDGRRNLRAVLTSAVGIATTVVIQVFVGEEVLFLTALTLVVMTITYAVANPALTRRVLPGFAAGMLLATVLASALLAYPLWFQFAGPQSVPNGLFSPHYFSADLASWPAISPLSVTGAPENAGLTTGPAEYNTFLGWPLLLLAVVCAAWLVRRPLTIACVVAAVTMASLSLGPEIVINGERSELSGPYSLLLGLPVVDGALPMRFALAVVPLIATVLVLAIDRALGDQQRAVRVLVPAAVVAALLPLFPKPLPTAARPPVPQFIADGHWRDCVRPGGVLVPVPLPTPKEPWPMRWSTAADVEFSMPEGFFIGPYAAHGKASMGTYKQPTSALLAEVAKSGAVPPIGDEHRRQARRDVEFWNASCVVLAADTRHVESLRSTLEALFGPATRVADAWVWRVG